MELKDVVVKKSKEPFDYGDIKKQHKEAIVEAINVLNNTGQQMSAALLENKFKIKDNKKYDLNESAFAHLCKKFKMPMSVQGYVTKGVNENAVDYPIVLIQDEISKLDEFIAFIQKNVK
jgi:hypothetical protein